LRKAGSGKPSSTLRLLIVAASSSCGHQRLNKVMQHGKRADTMLKSPVQHSREGPLEHRP
jgi:hypothetical protein